MKLRSISLFTILFFILTFPSISFSEQESENVEVHRIQLKDGSVVIGTILSEDDISIKFRTLSNVEMDIQKDQIEKIELVSGRIVKGELWQSDPNRTRLLFAPTARPLKAGQGYFSVYEIFFPFIAIGVTDYFAISGGMTLIPGSAGQAFYVAPKITPIQAKDFDIAGGVLYIRVPDEEEGAGIVYGVATYGKEEYGLTFGLGFGFAGGEFADKPILALGGEFRISKSIKFLTENWFIPDSEVQLLSFGIRFFGKHLAADFGLIYPAGGDTEGFPFIPWIGFVYNFGSPR